MEGNNKANWLVSVGLHSHALYPFNRKAELHTPTTLDMSKQIDFSVALSVVLPLDSQKASSIPQSVPLELILSPT